MRDKRPVDELSIEELEQVLAIRRREARQQSMQKMQRSGRMIEPEQAAAQPPAPAPMTVPALEALLQQSSEALPLATAAPYAATTLREPARPTFHDEAAPATKSARHRSPWADRLLLFVEVAAVIGVVFIGGNLIFAIRNLEAETASSQALSDEMRRAGIPTIAPTPSLRMENVVLPGGHQVTESGQVVFNYDEVPAQYLPLVESQWIQPVAARPQATSETAVALVIPRLNINTTIVQGVDWEALKQGVGQLYNGYDPSDDFGNVVFAAHNDVYGELFRYLDQLAAGDTFQIQTNTTTYTYAVTDVFTVEPDDVSVLEPRDGATATLISCYPYRVNDQRIIVYADRIT
jgi:sortase A